jgi:hypothetical protein
VHDHLTATELHPLFGERIPLINPRRSISTRRRCESGRQSLTRRSVQIFEGDESIDCASMGRDPDTAGRASRSADQGAVATNGY